MDEFGGSFLGSSLPEEVKALSKLLRSDPPVVDDGALRAIMKHALSISVGGAVQSKEAALERYNKLKRLCQNDSLTVDILELCVSAFSSIFKAALRSGTPLEQVYGVCQDAKLPEPVAKGIVQLLKLAKKDMNMQDKQSSGHDNMLPSLTSVRWRVAASISTNTVNRSLRSVVHMELKNSSNDVERFEMSAESFHMLRYNVARALKAMDDGISHIPAS
jgi:hypothetical protein